MIKISYSGYRFPPEIIQHAIWLYIRFTLSFRDVEDLLAERGIMVSYETVRRWVNHFGPMVAADLRKRRPKPHTILASGRSLSENLRADPARRSNEAYYFVPCMLAIASSAGWRWAMARMIIKIPSTMK